MSLYVCVSLWMDACCLDCERFWNHQAKLRLLWLFWRTSGFWCAFVYCVIYIAFLHDTLLTHTLVVYFLSVILWHLFLLLAVASGWCVCVCMPQCTVCIYSQINKSLGCRCNCNLWWNRWHRTKNEKNAMVGAGHAGNRKKRRSMRWQRWKQK